MKNTGIVRKIDELGRIVLPKELRKTLNINPGDDFEIKLCEDKILLEKYSRLENFEETIMNIINCFSFENKYKILLSINDKIVNDNNYEITSVVSNIIRDRKLYINDKIDINIISDNIKITGRLVILPIVINSDLLGSIIVISNENINNMIYISKTISNIIKKVILNN